MARYGVVPLFLLISASASSEPPKPPREPERPAGVEKVETQLVQLDVGVEGDVEAVRRLTPSDLELLVDGRKPPGLVIDKLCGPIAPAAPTSVAPAAAPVEPTAVVPSSTPTQRPAYLFFFDQPHLTLAGRARSLSIARDLVDRLVVGGARATIVSNGDRLRTIVPLTADPVRLRAGLDSLRSDVKQWSAYAELEPNRMFRLADEIVGKSCEAAIAHARVYAEEERQEARRTTERLATALHSVEGQSLPKAVILFADTLRQDAGRHYYDLALALAGGRNCSAPEFFGGASFGEFDRMVQEVLATGIHLFTVEAQGMTSADSGMIVGSGTMPTARERLRQSEDTLHSLADQTGGEAFVGAGARSDRIAEHITARTSCAFLFSFPPGDFPHDRPLPITVSVAIPGVKLRAQDRIVIESGTAREARRLLTGFVDPGANDDGTMHLALVPESGDGHRWKARLQVRVGPRGHAKSRYDLGASVVAGDKVVESVSTTVASSAGDLDVVLEKSIDLPRGPFEVVGVANDKVTGDVLSTRLSAEWPDGSGEAATIAPIAVVQAVRGVFSKDGAARATGRIARDEGEPVDPAVPVAFTTIACRTSKRPERLIVERALEGSLGSDFAPMAIEPDGEACIAIVDVIPKGRLGAAPVDYRVVVRAADAVVANRGCAVRAAPR
jgi:hypothetical protein